MMFCSDAVTDAAEKAKSDRNLNWWWMEMWMSRDGANALVDGFGWVVEGGGDDERSWK